MSTSAMAATSGWRAERIPLSTSSVASAALRPCFSRGVAANFGCFTRLAPPPSLHRPLTRSFPSFPSPAVHGESGRDGEGGVAAAPSTSGGGTASRFALAATTATAIAAATIGLSVVARDARAPLGGLGAVDASFFPDVAVVGGAGSAARARVKADWNANHAGGFEAVRVVPTLDARAWPDGDYPTLRRLIDAELGASAEKVSIIDLDDDGARARVLAEAEADGEDVDAAAEAASRSAQHLVAMLDARSRDAPALVVADRDASISALGGAFAHAHVGRPEEFDSVLLSFLYKGPKTWDVLWCDKGAGGVAEAAAERPALTMRNDKWVGDYDVFRWTGENGMRGSGLYVVSQRFLRALPKRLDETGDFSEVASFLAGACAEGGDAACFSYLERRTARSGAKMAALGAVDASRVASRRVNISWRDTVVTAAAAKAKRPASLGALMVGGERAGDAETLETRHGATALGRAAPVVAFDDDEDWDDLTKPKDLDAKAVKELVAKGRDAHPKAVSEKTRKSSKDASNEDAFELAPKSSKSSKPSSKPKAVSEKTRKSSKDASNEDAFELAPKSSKSSKPSSKPKAVSEKTRKSSKDVSNEDAFELAPKSSKSSKPSSKSSSSSSTRASSTPPPRTTSKYSSTSTKRPSSTASKHRSSKSSSKDSTKDADVDVDSMLDWWSDLPSATRDAGVKKAREDDDGAPHARPGESASSRDDLSDALDDAASSFLSGTKHTNPRRPSAEATEAAPARKSTSATATATAIQASPVLEREGDLLPDDPETLARRREASREASEGDERDMRASAQMTDAGADARAESGRWREEKPITLHTISPEEALKYVSRVHHKEEVEAAEAAAELARQEAEQKSLREDEKARVDDSYLAAVEDAYDDITGDRDARRSWSAVGSREESRSASSASERDDVDDGDYATTGSGDYEALASDYDGHVSAGVSNPEDYDEDERLASALAELTGARPSSKSKTKTKKLSSRPPTLKKSPHSVDVHAKHARHAKHAARAAASSKQRAAARRSQSSERSTLGRGDSKPAENAPAAAIGYSRAQARAAAAKAAEAQSAAPAAPAERLAGGAWRSAFTETQDQVSYASRARTVFDGSAIFDVPNSGPGAASLGAARRVGAMNEAELAALVEAADGALDDFGPRA